MKRGRKLGQVTIFFIIGIAIIGAVIIGMFILRNINNSNNNLDSSSKERAESIYNSILDCQKIAADNSVMRIGMQGGYSNYSSKYFDLGWTFIPYYYSLGTLDFPTKENVEDSISKNFDSTLENCIDFIDTSGMTLIIKVPKTKVEISKDVALFNTDMSFSIGNNGSVLKYNLVDSPYLGNYKIYNMYEVAKYITDSHSSESKTLCMDCLVEMADSNSIYVDFANIDENTKMVILSEKLNNSIGDFVYQFIEEYTPQEKSNAPKISGSS